VVGFEDLVNHKLAEEYAEVLSPFKAAAIEFKGDTLHVGVTSTLDGVWVTSLREAINDKLGFSAQQVKFIIVPGTCLDVFANSNSFTYSLAETDSQVEKLLSEVEHQRDDLDDIQRQDSWVTSTAGKALMGIVNEALGLNATDVHMRSRSAREGILCYRIDGDMHEMHVIRDSVHKRLTQVVKNASDMDVSSQNTKAQDGSIKLDLNHGKVTLRASVVPNMYRERTVLRLLMASASGKPKSLSDLGYYDDEILVMRKGLMYSSGMILVTGPTGSGKNTTMYAMLRESYNKHLTYLSAEDPIEMILPFMDQTEVTLQLPFASILRSFMRQDPDVMMTGEIRDEETAEVSSHAAMTGHKLFSTLHTNNAPDTLLRLEELGISRLTISQTVNLLIAQRLSKRVCKACRIKVPSTIETFQKYLPALDLETVESLRMEEETIYVKNYKGCEECGHTGNKGRTVIPEVIYVDRFYKTFLLNGDLDKFSNRMREQKMDMLSSAMKRVYKGILSIEDVANVIPRQ